MSALANLGFKEIWVVDFEFGAERGERPVPICLVTLESRRKLELWPGELQQLSAAPYNTGPDSLVVAYYASAEMGCHLAWAGRCWSWDETPKRARCNSSSKRDS